MADIRESKQTGAAQKEVKENAATPPKFCLMIGFGGSPEEIALELFCWDTKEFISIHVKDGAIDNYLSNLQKAGLVSFGKTELHVDCISGKEKEFFEALQKDKKAQKIILGSRFEHYYIRVTGKGAPQTLATSTERKEELVQHQPKT